MMQVKETVNEVSANQKSGFGFSIDSTQRKKKIMYQPDIVKDRNSKISSIQDILMVWAAGTLQ